MSRFTTDIVVQMKFLKTLFDFYINSSIHVGLEVCCFVLVTCLQFDIPFYPNFIAFVFFGTVTGYNFIKYAGLAKLHHKSLSEHLKIIQIFSFFSFLALVYFTLQLPFKTLLWVGLFGIFTILYAIPFLPASKNLRNLKGLKIFIIAFVVAGLTVVVPVIQHQLPIDSTVWWVSIQRIAFIIAVVIPFEIRDLNYDKAELGTIPQVIGVVNAKLLGVGLLVIFMGIEYIKQGTSMNELFAAVIVALVSAGSIVFATRNRSKYYASFWVEGIPIFWFLCFWGLLNF